MSSTCLRPASARFTSLRRRHAFGRILEDFDHGSDANGPGAVSEGFADLGQHGVEQGQKGPVLTSPTESGTPSMLPSPQPLPTPRKLGTAAAPRPTVNASADEGEHRDGAGAGPPSVNSTARSPPLFTGAAGIARPVATRARWGGVVSPKSATSSGLQAWEHV